MVPPSPSPIATPRHEDLLYQFIAKLYWLISRKLQTICLKIKN